MFTATINKKTGEITSMSYKDETIVIINDLGSTDFRETLYKIKDVETPLNKGAYNKTNDYIVISEKPIEFYYDDQDRKIWRDYDKYFK